MLHGSVASRTLLRSLAAGVEVCVTVTLLDGLVLARSTFHHSVNYRSVVVMGVARPIEDEEARRCRPRRPRRVHSCPGARPSPRPPSPVELQQTLLLEVPIVEASVKVRTGGPVDDPEDLALAGVGRRRPPHRARRTAEADPLLASDVPSDVPPRRSLRPVGPSCVVAARPAARR